MGLEKFKYKIFPERKLIIRYYSGPFSIADYIQSTEETRRDSLYESTFNVINDLRDAESTTKIGDIHNFFEYIEGHKILSGKAKNVFLTKTVNQTVFTMMMGLLNHENLIGFTVFSTLEEAIRWVDLPESDLDVIEKAIQDLV